MTAGHRVEAPTVSFVTGAGSGIGRAVSASLASRGDVVVCTDIDAATAEATAASIGPPAGWQQLDVTDPHACDAAVAATVAAHGRLDVLVACAGIEVGGPAADLDDESWRRVLDVNLNGTFWCARAAGRAMVRAGAGGRIVLVGSVNSRVALPGQAAYCASKGGVAMLGSALAVDWAAEGITVNTVGPGVVDTPMSARSLADDHRREQLMRRTPLGRPATPDDIAAVVAFLASPEAQYVTGAYLPVDGGWLAS